MFGLPFFVSVLLPFGIPDRDELKCGHLSGVLFFVKLLVVFVLACLLGNSLSYPLYVNRTFNRGRLRHFCVGVCILLHRVEGGQIWNVLTLITIFYLLEGRLLSV